MAQTLAAKIEIDVSGAESSVKSLKSQLKDAKLELQAAVDKFGEMSPQAAKAASKVASIEDKMGDLKKLSDSFNPDAKFKGLSNAIQGAVGAFTALQGAQALFGSESKEVAQTLAKVQGALALSQGVNAVLEAKDSFKALGAQLMSYNVVQKAVTAAQRLWNIAMAANPIGAITVAITALIAGISALVGWYKSSAAEAKAQAKATDDAAKAVEKQSKALERSNDQFQKNIDFQIAYAKASGKSAEEVRKLELSKINEKIAFELSARATAYNTYELEKNRLASLKAAGASDEVIQKQLDVVKKASEEVGKQNVNVQKAYDERAQIQARHLVEIRQAQTDADKKAVDDAKEAGKKLADAKKEALDIQAAATRELLTAQQQEEYDINKDFEEKKKKLVEAGISDFSLIEEVKNKQLKAVRDKYAKEEEDKKKEELQKAKDYQDNIAKIESESFDLQTQNRIAKIGNRFEKERQQLEVEYQKNVDDALAILDDQSIKEEDRQRLYNERRSAIDKEYKDKSDAINFGRQEDAIAKQIENDNLSYDAKVQALDSELVLLEDAKKKKTITEEQYTAAVKKNSETRTKIAEIERDKKKAINLAMAGILTQFSDLVGKQTKAGKAAAIAGLVIEKAQAVADIVSNTQAAVAKDQAASPLTFGMPWSAFHIAQGALGVATTIKAAAQGIKEIKSADGGGGSTGGGGAEMGGSAPGGAAPIPPTPETTMINQEQMNQIGNVANGVRAYVVESDVTNSQERMVRLNRAARIN